MSCKSTVLGSLKFAVGYDCNLQCGFCLQRRSAKGLTLNFGLVERVLSEEMIRRDVKLITLTGGEPTLDRYLEVSLRTVELAHSLGMETCVFTNGVLLENAMLEQFHRVGLDRFRVSIYDPVDWSQVRNLMQRLKVFGFPAMVKYTVTKNRFGQLAELLAQVSPAGVQWFQIKPYNRTEDPVMDRQYEMEPRQVLDMARMLLEFRQRTPEVRTDLLPLCYEFLVDETLRADQLSHCHCGKSSTGYLVIGPTGDVRICGAYPEPIGNAYHDRVTDLWLHHPLLQQVRGLGTRPKPKECYGCKHWDKCTVTDCHSATYARFGNFDHANPQCPLVSKS